MSKKCSNCGGTFITEGGAKCIPCEKGVRQLERKVDIQAEQIKRLKEHVELLRKVCEDYSRTIRKMK